MSGLSSLDYINIVYIANQDNYFTTPSYWYWTMTPFVTAGGNAIVDRVNSVYLGGGTTGNGGNHPVVSLSSDAISGGVEQQQVHFLLDRKEDMNLKSKEPSETLFTRQRKSG